MRNLSGTALLKSRDCGATGSITTLAGEPIASQHVHPGGIRRFQLAGLVEGLDVFRQKGHVARFQVIVKLRDVSRTDDDAGDSRVRCDPRVGDAARSRRAGWQRLGARRARRNLSLCSREENRTSRDARRRRRLRA